MERLWRRSMKRTLELLVPSRLPARPPRLPMAPAERPRSAANIAELAPALSGGISRAVDSYCFGSVKAMIALRDRAITATRASRPRYSQSWPAFTAQLAADWLPTELAMGSGDTGDSSLRSGKRAARSRSSAVPAELCAWPGSDEM